MKKNEILKEQIMAIVKNQIRDQKPPETKMTFNRLLDLGYSDDDAKQLIGQCVAIELFEMLKHGKPYDNERYIKNLAKLPEEPFD